MPSRQPFLLHVYILSFSSAFLCVISDCTPWQTACFEVLIFGSLHSLTFKCMQFSETVCYESGEPPKSVL
ncbi:hypothetical protein KC19_8G114200 [Ceratodon purpureus]|uniref:Secreted protein n=1 Tax=Ceratodon purpureus TaxID=3225 RepID=A0A8T0H180_CERPU|nr:hypothetical protein KC19_8G114200 [Ceratodon purpureus]